MRESEQLAQRAAECRQQADAATLDNVRERCLRSERALMDMARRAARTEEARDARSAAAASGEQAAHDSSRPDFAIAGQPCALT